MALLSQKKGGLNAACDENAEASLALRLPLA